MESLKHNSTRSSWRLICHPNIYRRYTVCLLSFIFTTSIIYFCCRPRGTFDENSPNYLQTVRDDFLRPPAPPGSDLNLNYPIWQSPVTNYIQRNLLQFKKHGFFVEAGALNGEEISNSIQLEADYGWEGLLVEPDPRNLHQLYKKNRKSWVAPGCLSPTKHPQVMKMSVYNDYRHLTNIPGLFHKNDVPPNATSTEVNVQCFPLFTLLQALNITDVDYLSLDVEGAELAILKSIPFDQISIRVISVEMNKKDDLFDYLKSIGYHLRKTFDLPDKGVRDAIFSFVGVGKA